VRGEIAHTVRPGGERATDAFVDDERFAGVQLGRDAVEHERRRT
jgi:hypothetical protein